MGEDCHEDTPSIIHNELKVGHYNEGNGHEDIPSINYKVKNEHFLISTRQNKVWISAHITFNKATNGQTSHTAQKGEKT